MPRRREKQFGQARGNQGGQLDNQGYLPGVLDVGQPDISELTFRALQLKGSLPAHLDREIQLGLTVDDFTRPEYWWLRRGILGFWPVNLPATAAQFGTATLNGAAGVIAVIEQVIICNRAAGARQFLYGPLAAAPGAGGLSQGLSRDSRAGISASPAAVTGQAKSFAAPGGTIGSFTVTIPAGSSLVLNPNYVLVGVTSFFGVQALTVNEILDVQFQWRERVQLASEA